MLVLLWVGLWMLWPRPDADRTEPRRRAVTRIRLLDAEAVSAAPSRRDLLAFMDAPDDRQIRMDEATNGLAARAYVPVPHLLPAARAAWPAPLAGPLLPDIRVQAAESMRGYQSQWPPISPRDAGSTAQMHIEVRPSRSLRAQGFRAPPALLALKPGGTRTWELTYDVTCDTQGHAADVMLVDETPVLGVHSNVTRLLYQSTAEPGAPSEGRVTVRWAKGPDQPPLDADRKES